MAIDQRSKKQLVYPHSQTTKYVQESPILIKVELFLPPKTEQKQRDSRNSATDEIEGKISEYFYERQYEKQEIGEVAGDCG